MLTRPGHRQLPFARLMRDGLGFLRERNLQQEARMLEAELREQNIRVHELEAEGRYLEAAAVLEVQGEHAQAALMVLRHAR